MESQVWAYADLDRDLPKLSPAQQCCVLSGLLALNVELLQQSTELSSSPADCQFIFDRAVDCFNRLLAVDDEAWNSLREVHACNGRQIRFNGQAYGSYCAASWRTAHDVLADVLRAADRPGYEKWLLRKSGARVGSFPPIRKTLLKQNWSAICDSIEESPRFDGSELQLGINNEHLVVSPAAKATYLGDGTVMVGDRFIKLEGEEHVVLDSLIKLQVCTLSKLRKCSSVEHANKVLKRIKQKHPELNHTIVLPGGRNKGGYSTTILAAVH